MQQKTIYVLTDVNKELPKENCKIGIIRKGEFDFAYFINFNEGKNHSFDSVKQGLSYNQNEITHWLKQLDNQYVFSEKELKELITEAFEHGEGSAKYRQEYGEKSIGWMNVQQCINKLLNNE